MLLTAVFHVALLMCDVGVGAEGDAVPGQKRLETDSEVVDRTDGRGGEKTEG